MFPARWLRCAACGHDKAAHFYGHRCYGCAGSLRCVMYVAPRLPTTPPDDPPRLFEDEPVAA